MTAPATDLYDQIHEEYLAKASDPAWRFAMEVFLGELLQENALYHQAQIQAICDWAAERQLNRHKAAITKRYLVDRLSEVRKDRKHHGLADWAGGGSSRPTGRPADYDPFNEMLWQRSKDGRFARYVGPQHVVDRFASARSGKDRKGIHDPSAADPRTIISQAISQRPEHERNASWSNYGVLSRPEELPAGDPLAPVTQGQHQVDVAHAFDRMTWSLAQKTGNAKDKQRVQFVISSPDGYHRVETPEPGRMPNVDFHGGERVQFMTPVGPDHPVTIAGQAVNIGHVAGMNDAQAAKAGAVVSDVHGALTKTSWGDKMVHTSNALRVMNDNSSLANQAHAVASLFNILGPDASRAFGNKLKQLTYRYMGQEVAPANYSPTARKGRQVHGNGALQSTRDYERQLAVDLVPSIPSSTEYELALKAGSTPPSRGYILNDDGRVVSEAVGYADDWYTPFNLKKLPQMRGGSYVRTRGFGGLTPEDIRLAMRTGARRATVISNNGVFTMEFEPKALHWGHRFGFAGNGLIKRYAKALDAIQGGKVDQKDGENGKLSLNTQGYIVAMKDLQRQNPQWIVADNDQIPAHQSLREFGNIDRAEVTGEGAKDRGYTGPLSLHANEAMAGWADENLRETWSDKLGKFNWNSVDKGRIAYDGGMGVASRLRGDGRDDGPFGGSSTGGPRPSSGGGGGSGRVGEEFNRHGIRRGQIRVDNSGHLVNFAGEYTTPSGQRLRTWGDAQRQKEQLKSTNPEFTVPGKKFTLTDEYSSSRPAGTSTDVVDVHTDPRNAYEREARERSHHWSDDDAVATAQDVRKTLIRLKDLGVHKGEFKNWKALNLAYRGTVAPGVGYTGTDEYATLVDRIQKSPTFRRELATDLEDAIDGRHLSDEHTTLEPGQLLAGLREQEYKPEAVGTHHPEEREDEHGDHYASLDLDGQRPLLMSELANSGFVQKHIHGLKGAVRNGNTDEVRDKAKHELAEYMEFARLTDKITKMRQADEAAKRPVRSVADCLRKEPGSKAELYERLNRYYSGMIQHGQQVEAENVAGTAVDEAKALKGETVPATPRLAEGTGTEESKLPLFDEVVTGKITPESAASHIAASIADRYEDSAERYRMLRGAAKRYGNVAEGHNKMGNKEQAANLDRVSIALEDYADSER